jgi:hypothetical protein
MCKCRMKTPPYIVLKMEVEDKTYRIKIEIAIRKFISYIYNFVNYIPK